MRVRKRLLPTAQLLLLLGWGTLALADSGAEGKEADRAAKEIGTSAQRNENVPVYLLDTNEQREVNKRLGTSPREIRELRIEYGYFANELGLAPANVFLLNPPAKTRSWHGEVYEYHQNSVLNARSFFQVGAVQPSHQNQYGLSFSGPAAWFGSVTGRLEQQKIRGMVNGNVLVPLESERTPLATDPEVRRVVQQFLDAYPDSLPNRTDFDPRALNVDSPQRVDVTLGELRLDRSIGTAQSLALSYSQDQQDVDAFQFVAGQNPDTKIDNYRTRISHRAALSPETLLETGFQFQRTKSSLESEPNAVGPRVRVGFQIQELGPESEFPVDRALNTFTWGALLRKTTASGAHTLTIGGNLTRLQLNGTESTDLRGYFQFTNSFGRSAIENLRYGTPSKYEVTLGDVHRGFRNWRSEFFIGDQWRLSQSFNITFGVRYGIESRPIEVNRLNEIPYSCDCNNLAPRLALAYRLDDRLVLRASYMLSFGEIFPVTYQQIRNNRPLVSNYQVQNPDLLNPLKDIDPGDPTARWTPTFISQDLSTPYSHQYGLSLERYFGPGFQLRFSYIGSRTIKLFKGYVLNRAEAVPGIPLIPATIDQRRPDPRYYESYSIANGGVAYLDAGQVELRAPDVKGLSLSAAYTFAKAIDQGSDYNTTGANRDVTGARNQWQYDSVGDRKGLSDFDSPHAFVLRFAYRAAEIVSGLSVVDALAGGWTISGTVVAKSGTPFTLFVGSDAPGFGNVDGSPGDRPNVLDPTVLGQTVSDPDTAASILRPDRFAFVIPGDHRGDLGRNTFRKGPIGNLNLALSRQWSLTSAGDLALEFRVESYNVANTPQFDEPQRNLSSPSFGRITNTLNLGRVFQGGLRLLF